MKRKLHTQKGMVVFPKGIDHPRVDCDIMIDQVRAIDNKRLVKKVGDFPNDLIELVKYNTLIIFDFV